GRAVQQRRPELVPRRPRQRRAAQRPSQRDPQGLSDRARLARRDPADDDPRKGGATPLDPHRPRAGQPVRDGLRDAAPLHARRAEDRRRRWRADQPRLPRAESGRGSRWQFRRLSLTAREEISVCSIVWPIPPQFRIASAIDLAHRARADEPDDLVSPYPRARQQRHASSVLPRTAWYVDRAGRLHLLPDPPSDFVGLGDDGGLVERLDFAIAHDELAVDHHRLDVGRLPVVDQRGDDPARRDEVGAQRVHDEEVRLPADFERADQVLLPYRSRPASPRPFHHLFPLPPYPPPPTV